MNDISLSQRKDLTSHSIHSFPFLTLYVFHSYISKLIDDVGLPHKLIEVVFNRCIILPPVLGSPMRDRVYRNLMIVDPELLHFLIVGVLMRYKECAAYWTTVGISPIWREDSVVVELPVVGVDYIIEREQNHLWRLDWFEIAWNSCRVFGAETLGQLTNGRITLVGCIWIVLWITVALVAAVETVVRAIQ